MSDLFVDADGNLVLGSDSDLSVADDREAVKQELRIKLLTFFREWFLDESIGVDYAGEILVRDFKASQADREIRRNIMQVANIRTVKTIDISVDHQTQTATIRAEVLDVFSNEPTTVEVTV